MKTGIIEPSILNSKRIRIRVYQGQIKSGGMFSSSYIIYNVSVDPLGWTVQRKDSDFYFLRKYLLKMHPYLIIPPLPPKKKKDTDRFMRRRERFLTRFMQAISRSEELKADLFLQKWLQNEDPKTWSKDMKEAEKLKYVRCMECVKSM